MPRFASKIACVPAVTCGILVAGVLGWTGCETRPDRSRKQQGSESNGARVDDAQPDNHANSDQPPLPDNFTDGVALARDLRDKIRDAFAADDHEAAHATLHEMARLLHAMPNLVDRSNLPDAARSEAMAAIHELMQRYAFVDRKLHVGESAAYGDVAAKIDQAIDQLQPSLGPRPNAR